MHYRLALAKQCILHRIRTSDNYERICLNKYNFFHKFGFWASSQVKKIKSKTELFM